MKKKESKTIAGNADQRHSNLIRTLSVIMTVILICPVFSSAVDISGKDKMSEEYSVREETPYEYKLEAGDLTLAELKSARLDTAELPEEISPGLAEERGHVKRLYEQEPDRNTVMFQNSDGSKTIYYFSSPVNAPEGNNNAAGGTEANEASCAAFFISGKQITIKNANKVFARLGKSCENDKIYDYNIGYADLQYIKTKITGNGADITKELRELSRGTAVSEGEELMINACESIPGLENTDNNQAGQAYAVISITYSPIAGIINLKNKSTAEYLRNVSGAPAVGSYSAAYGRWILNYIGSGRYYIRSLTLTGNYKYLTANSAVTSVSLTDSQSRYSIWYIDPYEVSGQTYYYLRSGNSSGKALNGSLSFSTISSGTENEAALWQMINRGEIAVSIEYPETGLLIPGEPLESILTISPSNAATNISWFDVNNVIITETNDYGEPTITGSGIYGLWFEDRYSGIGITDTGEEDPVNILVPVEQTGFNLGRTFMIRPYADTSKYLTLTNTGANAETVQINNISVEGLSGGATGTDPAYTAKWTNKSQIFTLDAGNNGALRITATLCSGQYKGWTDCPNNMPLAVYDQIDYTNYQMTFQSDVTNTLYVSGNALSGRKPVSGTFAAADSVGGCVSNTDNGINWYLVDAGSTLFNAGSASEAIVHYYVIVNVSGTGSSQIVKALNNTTTGSGAGVSVLGTASSRILANLWYVNEIGINIPLIKQMRTTYCGYTTLLQIMYGAGTVQNLTSSTSLWDQTMVVGNSDHACGIGPGGQMDQWNICSYLNGTTKFLDGSFDKTNYRYYRTPLQTVESFHSYEKTNTKDKFVSLLRNSLQTGWGSFFLTKRQGNPYCFSSDGCHYVAIIGYDTMDRSFIVSNCHFRDYNFGIYYVPENGLYNSINTLFWAEEIN